MSTKDPKNFALQTLAVRAGHPHTPEGEHSEPIYPTSSFVFESASQAAARFSGDEVGNIYSRFTNPTVRAFEQRLAAMEGGEACVATASGMSAILSTLLTILSTGDHIVSSRSIFGSTVSLLNNILPKFGISTDFVNLTDVSSWEQAIRAETKLLFLETPSNPLLDVADIRQLADLAHASDCLLIVDNCLCTPALQLPLTLGADIVIHSATKYLDGQGRCVGGAVVGSQKLVGEEIFGFLRTAGPTMSPFNAWVFLKGLETLSLRMRAHCDAATEVAHWLQEQPQVERVYYPGLESHSQHQLAGKQQSGYGGMVSFEIAGGQSAAWQLIDRTEVFSITANLGDTKSTVTHPATTTHWKLTEHEKQQAGIRADLIRLSIGLEDIQDLKADLQQAMS